MNETTFYAQTPSPDLRTRPAPPKVNDPLVLLELNRAAGFVGRVLDTSVESFAQVASNITAAQLHELNKLASSRIGKCKGGILAERIRAGATLTVCKHANAKKGNYKSFLELANISRRDAYRFEHQFKAFGPYCLESAHPKFLDCIDLEAADLLSRPSTPSDLLELFIQQATKGVRVSYSTVHDSLCLPAPKNPNPNDKPSLSDKYANPELGIEIHTAFTQHTSREQLISAFQAALKDAISRLPTTQPDEIQESI